MSPLDFAVALAIMALTGAKPKSKDVQDIGFEGRVSAMVWPDANGKNLGRHLDALETAGWFKFRRGRAPHNKGRVISVSLGKRGADEHRSTHFSRMPKAICWDPLLKPAAKRVYAALAYIEYLDSGDAEDRLKYPFLFSYNRIAALTAFSHRKYVKPWVHALYEERLLDFPSPDRIVESPNQTTKTLAQFVPLEIRYAKIELARTQHYAGYGVHIYHPHPDVVERYNYWIRTGYLPAWRMVEQRTEGRIEWLFPAVEHAAEPQSREA